MERLSYLLRNGFDPTDCDNADNYYHPSDPLGPGPSYFGQHHQCTPSPRRPIPTDPFEAFRFFNRLQGLNERECSERAAFEYINRPRPQHVEKELRKHQFNRTFKQHVQQRKEKAERPDIIELFEGDEISNLYFYHPLHEAMKQFKILPYLFGFEIIPGKPPTGAIELPPSSLSSDVCEVIDPCKSEDFISPKVDQPVRHKFLKTTKGFAFESPKVNKPPVSDVKIVIPVTQGKHRLSSNTYRVASISLVRPKELSATVRIFLSMKGFIRLGVSLIMRDMEVVSQSTAIVDQAIFVTEFARLFPLIW